MNPATQLALAAGAWAAGFALLGYLAGMRRQGRLCADAIATITTALQPTDTQAARIMRALESDTGGASVTWGAGGSMPCVRCQARPAVLAVTFPDQTTDACCQACADYCVLHALETGKDLTVTRMIP